MGEVPVVRGYVDCFQCEGYRGEVVTGLWRCEYQRVVMTRRAVPRWSELKKKGAYDVVVGGRWNTKKVMVAWWAMEAETVGE